MACSPLDKNETTSPPSRRDTKGAVGSSTIQNPVVRLTPSRRRNRKKYELGCATPHDAHPPFCCNEGRCFRLDRVTLSKRSGESREIDGAARARGGECHRISLQHTGRPSHAGDSS